MIDPSAHVHPQAQLHPTVTVGPWCRVGPNVKIGAGTQLFSHVVVDGWTEIGENNQIFPFAVLGAVPQDLKYQGEVTRLVIGHHNTIRESVTMNLGTLQGGGLTQVGHHCLIMAYTHLGHDCQIGNFCIIANYGGLAGHVVLEDYVTLGGMTGVSQYVRVGRHAYIGGQSGLERDVPPYTIALGTRPTVLKGVNIMGLKRRGFSSQRIQKIQEAFKIWVSSELQKEACLAELETQFIGDTDIEILVNFIRCSETGVVRNLGI